METYLCKCKTSRFNFSGHLQGNRSTLFITKEHNFIEHPIIGEVTLTYQVTAVNVNPAQLFYVFKILRSNCIYYMEIMLKIGVNNTSDPKIRMEIIFNREPKLSGIFDPFTISGKCPLSNIRDGINENFRFLNQKHFSGFLQSPRELILEPSGYNGRGLKVSFEAEN